MKKTLTIIFFIALVLSLAFVWGAVYIWPQPLEWLDPISTRVEITLLLLGIPLILTGLVYSWKSWHNYRRRQQQNQELQYLLREKQRLNSSWKRVLRQLSKQPGGHNPYALPWLLMLGDDTSGKASWLYHAGFEPIQNQSQKSKEDSSSQDTRQQPDDVTFWVSEYAVVVELAGHFLTENSNELDVPILQHLYQLLRRYRARQPLTGILVAQPANQLITRQPTWLQVQARHLRRRLREIDGVVGIRLPVWLQVTQCDQLEGFQACFDQSCSNERSLPLGVPLPEGYQPEAWQQGFKALHHSLTSKLPDLLHNEKEVSERQAIGRFLLQMTLLQERIQITLDELYGNRHHAPEAWMAGIWLSSSIQEGHSYNLLASELGRLWGFQSTRQQPQRLGNNSYFIRNFFPKVALQTLALVGENRLAHHIWQSKILVIALASTLVLSGSSWVLWENVAYNRQLHARTQQTITAYQSEINELGTHAELADTMPSLLRLRELIATYDQPRPLMLSIGLFDKEEADSVRSAYYNQLQQRLFVPIAERMHDTLSAYIHLGDYHEVFRHLLHYLMLFDSDIRQTSDLNSYIIQMLTDRDELPEGASQYLTLLLDDLWKSTLAPLSENGFQPDEQLIIQAQSELGQRIDNQLVYDYIRSQPAHAAKVDIRNLLGQNFSSNFQFREGFEGYYLPEIYTREGYNKLDLSPESEVLQKAVASLDKVNRQSGDVSLADRIRISGKVRELYFLDYIRTWKILISNIELKPGSRMPQQLDRLEQLYQGESPALFNLIAAIADQTQLVPEEPKPGSADKNSAEDLVKRQAERKAAKALGLKGANKQIASGLGRSAFAKLEKQRSAAIVNEAFSAYATLFVDKGSALTEQLDRLNAELQIIGAHADTNQAYFDSVIRLINGEGSLPELQRLARQERTAVGIWLTQLTDQIWHDWINGAGQLVQKRWQSTIYRTWQSRLENRFPFVADARQEVRIGDFVEFLRPDGELDQFVATYLAPFVLSGTDLRWQIRTVNGATLPLSQQLLDQLNRADIIRDRYFSADGRLDIGYRMRARRLNSGITSFNLRDGNGNFTYSHGPQTWQERRWPQESTDLLSLNFANNGLQLARNSYTGPWAWQHFVADSRVWEGDNQVQLTYSLKSFDITLELELDRRGNPFEPHLLSGLSLPGRILARNVDNPLAKN